MYAINAGTKGSMHGDRKDNIPAMNAMNIVISVMQYLDFALIYRLAQKSLFISYAKAKSVNRDMKW